MSDMDTKDLTLEAVEFAEGPARNNVQLTDDERHRERRVKWKIDLIVLPLLATVYFLATMVLHLSPAMHHCTKQFRVARTWATRKFQEWTKS